MNLADLTLQGFPQVFRFGFQPSGRHCQESVGVCLPSNQGTQNRPSAHSQQIANQASEFDIGVFQGLLESKRMLGLFAYQLLARPRQSPNILDLSRGNKTRANEIMGQQVSDPSRIVDIGLSTRQPANLLRVGEKKDKGILGAL